MAVRSDDCIDLDQADHYVCLLFFGYRMQLITTGYPAVACFPVTTTARKKGQKVTSFDGRRNEAARCWVAKLIIFLRSLSLTLHQPHSAG